MRIKKILFIDLDGTLVANPLGSYTLPEIRRVLSEFTGLDEETVRRSFLETHLKLLIEDPLKAFDWQYITDLLLRKYSVNRSVDVVSIHKRYCDKTFVYDDAIFFLEKIRYSYDIDMMILATNGLSKFQECVISYANIEKYFDHVYTPDKKGCLKNSRCFFETKDSVNENVFKIMIGDDLVFDIYFPSLYGLKTIYIDRYDKGVRETMYMKIFNIKIDHVRPNYIAKDLFEAQKAIHEILSLNNR